eukprot:TRINITY_DN13978_c0_g1_i1.p1 TRINITY_DN13978_c0_g1~~TRINITY_DN13978_c0_g1_i1.p1  ORF type:complete len:348 (-),score=69.96 TRINITY_DN13978_c0_g1_i1:235-1254(-)
MSTSSSTLRFARPSALATYRLADQISLISSLPTRLISSVCSEFSPASDRARSSRGGLFPLDPAQHQYKSKKSSSATRCFTATEPVIFSASSMASSTFGRPAEKTLTIEPVESHTATVVWLHGLGDTGDGWRTAADMLAAALPHVKWVLPTAPVRNVTCNGGFPCTAWFDIFGLSEEAPEDVRGLDAAASFVGKLLDDERQLAEKNGRQISLALGGFSQGGALSLHYATKLVGSNSTDVLKVPLSAVVCVSGWLPNAKDFKMAEAGKSIAQDLNILMCHGRNDMVVQHSFGSKSALHLQSVGFSRLQFRTYVGVAHEVNKAEMTDIARWLQQQLPLYGPS